ncbi:MAG: hypothetical protein OEV78_05705, partial [Spirochaetia bacterium]|nr:hypothetical protein [Spirochaetia bacterium]
FSIWGDKASVKVKISWSYENISEKIELFEYNPASQLNLWATGEKKTEKELPISKKISGSQFISTPGENYRFVLVMKNTSSEKKYFFAAPHIAQPGGYSLGFKFKCLCVNMVYNVSPGMYWYRVVELRISPAVKSGEIDFHHQITGLSEPESQEYMKSFYEQMNEDNRMPNM